MNYRNLKSLEIGLSGYMSEMQTENPNLYNKLFPEVQKFLKILTTTEDLIEIRFALKGMENINNYILQQKRSADSLNKIFYGEGQEIKTIVRKFADEEEKLKCFLNTAFELKKEETLASCENIPLNYGGTWWKRFPLIGKQKRLRDHANPGKSRFWKKIKA